MTDLTAHGVSVRVPAGWEGRVYRREPPGQPGQQGATPRRPAPSGTSNAVVQLSTIALPADTADFASNAVGQLGPEDALVVLFEYDAVSAAQPLFAAQGIPGPLATTDFSPSVLQRSIRGQAGAQRFFQHEGRAFSLYVVLGSFQRRRELVDAVNAVLATLEITPPSGSAPPPHTILELVALQGDLTTLAELLGEPGPRALLDHDEPTTLFAPDDDAFATIDLAALRDDDDLLLRTVKHHLVAGAIPIDELAATASVTPLEGDPLEVRVEGGPIGAGGRVLVDGVPVVRPDLVATNGVVHVITGVLEVER